VSSCDVTDNRRHEEETKKTIGSCLLIVVLHIFSMMHVSAGVRYLDESLQSSDSIYL
jgi:hypothetical protein